MTLQPWDERYDPEAGSWTCPMCLRRREFDEGQSDELGHLCDECAGILRNGWPEAEESEWVWTHGLGRTWYLNRVTGCGDSFPQAQVMVGRVSWFDGPPAYYVAETRVQVEHRGTLSECAHALVAAVRGEP